MYKIIFLDNLTAIKAEAFIPQFLARLEAKNVNIKPFDTIRLTKNFLKLYNNDAKIDSQEFYNTYLTILYTKLIEIERLNTEDINANIKDTYYIFDEIPFLYNIFEKYNKQAEILFSKFVILHKYITFISLTTLTEFKINSIQMNATHYQDEIYKTFPIKTREEQINTVELLKSKINDAFMFFRKNNINCIKANLNYAEDISKAINKIFKNMQI